MQTTIAPSGDSHSISINAPTAPRRLGRPRVHANDVARTTAYRARVRQRRLGAAPEDGIRHHKYCTAKLGYCLCDLPLDKGLYLQDAPKGCGKLQSGGYGNEKLTAISELHQAREIIGGRRASPKGHGVGIEDKKWSDHEADETFVDRQKFPPKWKESEEQKALRATAVAIKAPCCCVCSGPATTIHPEDKRKRLSETRFMCGSHLMLFDLRKAVLHGRDGWHARCKWGPCGAVAVALSRLGFGKVARVYAVSAEGREDCIPPMGKDWITENCVLFPHYVVVTPEEEILDVSLPADFVCVGYEDLEICGDGDDVHQDDEFNWDGEDFSFWLNIFTPIARAGGLLAA